MEFLVIALVLGAFYGLYFLYKWFFSNAETINRILRKVAIKPIRNVVNGEVARVVGEVQIIGKSLIALLSKRECAYYYIVIEEYLPSLFFRRTYRWKKIIEDEVAGNFLIKDGKHYARLNGKKVRSYIVQDKNYSSGLFKNATDDLKQYLHDKGWDATDYFGFNKKLRYKEGILENGEMVTIMGKAEWQPANKFNLSSSYGNVLTMNATDELSIYLSDDPVAFSEYEKPDYKKSYLGKL